jgi:hypothetical protein
LQLEAENLELQGQLLENARIMKANEAEEARRLALLEKVSCFAELDGNGGFPPVSPSCRENTSLTNATVLAGCKVGVIADR